MTEASTQVLPWFDLFLDLPHPRASPECPGAFVIPAPASSSSSSSSSSFLQQITPHQVAQFAFPEIAAAVTDPSSSPANTRLNRYDVYATQTTNAHFTFSWQLADGRRLHGHVRRYLPSHLAARTRFDVGRRGERALVLLTRHAGTADALYAAVLKTIDAISSQQVSVGRTNVVHNGSPQQWFLYQLLATQQAQQQAMNNGGNAGANNKSMVATITSLEFDDENFAKCDTHRFILPASLLARLDHSSSSSSSEEQHNAAILPLLRCLGISNALRVLSGLLSERRIVFCSASPTRLTKCSHAALSMLNAGGLQWHHVFIPVLCPHIFPMLAAPYPYLIGILDATVLNAVDGVGEVLIVHLDGNTLETRGMSERTVATKLPDIVLQSGGGNGGLVGVGMLQQLDADYGGAAASALASSSPCDVFLQDLQEVLRQDKKLLYGDSALERVGETAAKAKEVVRKTFNKLKDRFQQQVNNRSDSASTAEISSSLPQDNNDAPESASSSMSVDGIATETCHNEAAEHEVRIAFCTFYLTFYGDVRWYLTKAANGQVVLDRKRFVAVKQREYNAIMPNSPMLQLAQNFCQTQLLEEFATARIAAIASSSNNGSSNNTLLFFQCEQYLRQRQMEFSVATVQRIARHIADGNNNSGLRLTGLPVTNARPTAMNLTSNKAFENSADTNRLMAALVEQCRECSSVLTDVMSVIWLRLRDCKGLQWKHAVLALQLLRNLLYHGPLTAITEATDGLHKIRSLKYYENIRPVCAQQVSAAAAAVYGLLVDRATLFTVRRTCADRRRKLHDPSANANAVPRRRQQQAHPGVAFRQIHALMHPSAVNGTVVQIPPKGQLMSRGGSGPSNNNNNGMDDFGGTGNGDDDILGLFGGMGIGTEQPQRQQQPTLSASSSQDFDAFVVAPQPPVTPPTTTNGQGPLFAPQQQPHPQQPFPHQQLHQPPHGPAQQQMQSPPPPHQMYLQQQQQPFPAPQQQQQAQAFSPQQQHQARPATSPPPPPQQAHGNLQTPHMIQSSQIAAATPPTLATAAPFGQQTPRQSQQPLFTASAAAAATPSFALRQQQPQQQPHYAVAPQPQPASQPVLGFAPQHQQQPGIFAPVLPQPPAGPFQTPAALSSSSSHSQSSRGGGGVAAAFPPLPPQQQQQQPQQGFRVTMPPHHGGPGGPPQQQQQQQIYQQQQQIYQQQQQQQVPSNRELAFDPFARR